MTSPSLDELIRSAVREALAEELPRLLAEHHQRQRAQDKRMLTVPNLIRAYGIGRGQILDLIHEGRLPAVSCRMRGGREGWRVRVEDAERVLAGVAAT